MWRPDNWKNPYGGEFSETDDIYEEGADAILEALKEKGAFMTPRQMELLAPDRKYPYGWLVFIEDLR